MKEPNESRTWRDYAYIFGPGILFVLLGALLMIYVPAPAPAKHIVIATGSPSGAYHRFAQRYRDILAREGVELELQASKGSVENLKLLASGSVDVAFVQGGTANAASGSQPDLVSLASVYYEPIWIFHAVGGNGDGNGDGDSDAATNAIGIANLRGKRIAIGGEGSGTRALANVLLKDNGIGNDVTLVNLGGQAAAKALRAGQLDAMFVVASASTEIVQQLIRDPQARLMSLRRAPAYATRHGYLSPVTLHEGVLDLEHNLPSASVSLLAPAASLVTRKELHPALVSLLLTASKEVHGGGDLFAQPGVFPAASMLEFPLHEDAQRWHQSGPSLLQRYLPFWAATLVDRLIFMLLPLIALLFPVVRLMMPTYRWRVRSRIYRWYRELQAVEQSVIDSDVDSARLTELHTEIDRIENDARKTRVPLAYTDELYNLRMHIKLVRDALPSQLPTGAGDSR